MQKADEVRQLIWRTLIDLGFAEPKSQGEVHLLRNGHVVGRGFRFVGVRAIWMTDAEAVVFYDQDGGYLRTVTISEGRRREAG